MCPESESLGREERRREAGRRDVHADSVQYGWVKRAGGFGLGIIPLLRVGWVRFRFRFCGSCISLLAASYLEDSGTNGAGRVGMMSWELTGLGHV